MYILYVVRNLHIHVRTYYMLYVTYTYMYILYVVRNLHIHVHTIDHILSDIFTIIKTINCYPNILVYLVHVSHVEDDHIAQCSIQLVP